MSEFEERIRDAFDAELNRTPARPGLRQRVIANAVATPRTRPSWFSLWLTPPRLAMVGAAAAVLVIAGIGFRVAMQGTPITAQKSPTPSVLAFGKLPAPALHPLPGGQGGPATTPTVLPYFGPANMAWAGTVPKAPSSAPVYGFNLPDAADADKFAARFGATLISADAGNGPRQYRLPNGSTLTVRLGDPTGEPTFDIERNAPPTGTVPLGESAARAAADAELARLRLTPSWKFAVSVTTLPPMVATGPEYVVQYQRLIDVSAGVTAGQVDSQGNPAGIQVVVDSSGAANSVSGVLRLAERSASYPVRSPSSAIHDAITSPPSEGQTFPTPNVSLTNVTLVYAVVTSGRVGYLEPAYLFTGQFTAAGSEWEKRVLVSALPASQLAP